MAFTVRDFHDLVELLEQHPEWRAELRRLVLTEELLALPQVVHELAEAQRRTEQQIAELVAAQRRTEQRIGRLQDDVGGLKGIVLEERYYRRAPAYFLRLVRQSQVVAGNELAAMLGDAVRRGLLTEAGYEEIMWADPVVRGQRQADGTEVYLVVEVSWGVGTDDVERAARRAAFLAQTGVQTLPVVAGDHITDEAAELCRAMQVWQVLDGRTTAPNGHRSSG
ncbi:MAG TPA: hypothetical protein VIH59_02945 [Candidatus Tectomicrobia bacterium]|jgi:hypothetical protein